jgi:hypothetical protein
MDMVIELHCSSRYKEWMLCDTMHGNVELVAEARLDLPTSGILVKKTCMEIM